MTDRRPALVTPITASQHCISFLLPLFLIPVTNIIIAVAYLVPACRPRSAHDFGLAREVLVFVVINNGVHGHLGGSAEMGKSKESMFSVIRAKYLRVLSSMVLFVAERQGEGA